MRCMVFVKASKESEAGILPGTELLTSMGKFNEELVKAGVMLAGEGLKPSSAGKRITFTAGKAQPKRLTRSPSPAHKLLLWPSRREPPSQAHSSSRQSLQIAVDSSKLKPTQNSFSIFSSTTASKASTSFTPT